MKAREIRAKARKNLENRWGKSILAAGIAGLLGTAVGGNMIFPQAAMFPSVNMDLFGRQYTLPSFLSEVTDTLQATPLPRIMGILAIVAFIIGGAIEIAHAAYLLKEHDGQAPEAGDLIKGLRLGDGFCQMILRAVLVVLWSMLLIFPGIMAFYAYAMTPFILAEDPTIGGAEAIRRSKLMMRGHKWELCKLDLSFIGWMFLAALTMNLGNLALNPYMGAAHAVFYRNLQAAENA